MESRGMIIPERLYRQSFLRGKRPANESFRDHVTNVTVKRAGEQVRNVCA